MENQNKDQLLVRAKQSFNSYEEMYKVVDFLNKNLKDKGIIVGLSKNIVDNNMIITIYEV
ncbi:MAG: YpmA family protein [Clostridia bacterium]|jgi:hypothetical protein|nr:YpmA family protein [Clostridia bacterium]